VLGGVRRRCQSQAVLVGRGRGSFGMLLFLDGLVPPPIGRGVSCACFCGCTVAAIPLSGRTVVCFTTQDLAYLATVPTADVLPAPGVARAAESELRDETLIAFDTNTNRGGLAFEAEVLCAATGIFSCGTELFLDSNVSAQWPPTDS
jgi:hypothetical protein